MQTYRPAQSPPNLVLLSIAAIFSLVSIGCSDTVVLFPPMTFEVRNELLDSLHFVNLEYMDFSLPKGYVALHDSIINKANIAMNGQYEDEIPIFELKSGYYCQADSLNLLLISQAGGEFWSKSEFHIAVRNYDVAYQKFAPDAQTTVFSINGINCWQARRIEGKRIHFRWIFGDNSEKKPTQIDFFYIALPDADMGRVIESMLGTVRLTH
ncbi:MAG: hypothetical protein FJY65_04210 [Calditrichaeota bacterium]|nr:hypothetical protein [Calditrichota bacterium]